MGEEVRRGRGGWRYLAIVVVLPLVVMIAIAPALVASDRSGGLNSDSGVLMTLVVMIVGWVATLLAIVRALAHRFPLERSRYGRLPLAIAAAAMSGAVAANVVIAPLGLLLVVVAFWSALGGIAGWHLAAAVLGSTRLPTTNAPAPSGAARHDLDPGATAVWIGRAPPLPLLTWLGPILVAVAMAWMFAPDVLPWGFVVGWSAMWIGVNALSQRRVRVVIGRSGLCVLGGAHRWERRDIPLENIVSGSCIALHRWWWVTAWRHRSTHRLMIATRPGPAMLVELTDGSEVVVSLRDPADAVGVLNSLLDNRGAKPGIERL